MSLRTGQENQILFIKNLPYTVSSNELYELFGRFGAIRQIRIGNVQNTKGTAFVVYEDVHDARMAFQKLSGFNYQNRYLVVLYHDPDKVKSSIQEDLDTRRTNLENLKEEYGIK